MAGRHRVPRRSRFGADPASARARRAGQRRRRFPPPRPDLRARPLLQLCPAPRGAPGRRASAGSARAPVGQPVPRRSGGTHRRARPGRRGRRSVRPAPARSAWRRRRSRPALRAPALAAVQPRAQQRASGPLPARQRASVRQAKRGGLLARTQRGRVGADQVQHAVQQIIRRCASADDADSFVDGAMAVALQEVQRRRGETGCLAAARRASPSRAGRVRAARPAPHRRCQRARSISA